MNNSTVTKSTPPNTENDKDTDTNAVDTRQEESEDNIYPSTIQDDNTSEGSTIKERADMLLRTGVMPMIPLARREWRMIATSIEKGTLRSIVWPPENWEVSSADDRLTACSYDIRVQFRYKVREE